MFGYIMANQMELKVKEYRVYQSWYCGICRCLKKRYGQYARLVLSYDMTFVALLLQGLYEMEEKEETIWCPFHPFQKKQVTRNEICDYVADMNVLLAYHNWEDDWMDEHNIKSRASMVIMRRAYKKIAKRYQRQHKSILTYMQKLEKLEQDPERYNLDDAANLTGEMFQEILVWKEDMWSKSLRKIGYALGRFIYYMDAYDDLEEDRKLGNYNPFLDVSEETIEEILKMVMAQAADSFEYLPIIEYGEILRNILYSGVWIKYCQIKQRHQEKA